MTQQSSGGANPKKLVKAWVGFSTPAGVPTIQNSFNVSSITDNGVGDFTINFTTPFTTIYYASSGWAYLATLNLVVKSHDVTASTTSARRMVVFNNVNVAADPTEAGMIFCGDQ